MEDFVSRAQQLLPTTPYQQQWEAIFEGLTALTGCRQDISKELDRLRAFIKQVTPAGFLVPIIHNEKLTPEFFVRMRALPAYPIQITSFFLEEGEYLRSPVSFAEHDLFHASRMVVSDSFWVLQEHAFGGLTRNQQGPEPRSSLPLARSSSANDDVPGQVSTLSWKRIRSHEWITPAAFAHLIDLRVTALDAALDATGSPHLSTDVMQTLVRLFHEGMPTLLCIEAETASCSKEGAIRFDLGRMKARAKQLGVVVTNHNARVIRARVPTGSEHPSDLVLKRPDGLPVI